MADLNKILEEIKELGVDIQDPSNWYEYTYSFTYTERYTYKKYIYDVNLKPGTTTKVTVGGSNVYLDFVEVEGERIVTAYKTDKCMVLNCK